MASPVNQHCANCISTLLFPWVFPRNHVLAGGPHSQSEKGNFFGDGIPPVYFKVYNKEYTSVVDKLNAIRWVAAAMRPFSVTVSNSIEQTIFISPLSVTKLFIDNRLAQEQAVAMQQVYRERKCADTNGTVLVPMLKYN